MKPTVCWREDVTRDAKLFRLDYNHLLLREDLEESVRPRLRLMRRAMTSTLVDLSAKAKKTTSRSHGSNEVTRAIGNCQTIFARNASTLRPAPLKETGEWLTASDMRSFHGERGGRNFAYRWDFDDSRWKPCPQRRGDPARSYSVGRLSLRRLHRMSWRFQGKRRRLTKNTKVFLIPSISPTHLRFQSRPVPNSRTQVSHSIRSAKPRMRTFRSPITA